MDDDIYFLGVIITTFFFFLLNSSEIDFVGDFFKEIYNQTRCMYCFLHFVHAMCTDTHHNMNNSQATPILVLF